MACIITTLERNMKPNKTYILVEITHKGPIKKALTKDLQSRLSQAAYDLIQARGANCLNAKAKQVDEHCTESH